tara:strand:+ start:2074 stop:2643 length:570 start_codon:yes stop_codon:yes gene_type:complete
MEIKPVHAKDVYLINKISNIRSTHLMAGVISYKPSLNGSRFINETKDTRTILYCFSSAELAKTWKDLYETNEYDYSCENIYKDTIYFNFNKKSKPSYIDHESIYNLLNNQRINQMKQNVEVVSLDDLDEELVSHMTLCHYMAIAFIFEIITNTKGYVLKSVYIDPFKYIDAPDEIEEIVINNLEMNYYI